MKPNELDKAIAALQARRAARGANDPLARLRANVSGAIASGKTDAIGAQVAPRVVNAWDLSASDFDGAPNNCVIVKTGKASNFRVERQAPGIFIVYGRTEFIGGSTVVRGIDGVRRLLATR